jgi:hypothetical protein
MAFYPVPVKVLRNLLFLSLNFIILLFFLRPAINFFFYDLLCGLSRCFLLCFGRNILWIRIRHWRM